MLRNSLPLSRIIGIAFIGISVFLFSILAFEMMRPRYDDFAPDTFSTANMLQLAGASAALFMGIGMILRLKWARMLLVFIVVGFGAFLTYEIVRTLDYDYSRSLIGIGGVVCIITLCLCFGLLMYNEKLNQEFNDEPQADFYDDAIDLEMLSTNE